MDKTSRRVIGAAMSSGTGDECEGKRGWSRQSENEKEGGKEEEAGEGVNKWARMPGDTRAAHRPRYSMTGPSGSTSGS